MGGLNIGLDATYSLGSNLSGVGIYCREILQGLAAAHPETDFHLCYRSHRILRSFVTPLPPNCRRRLLRDAGVAGLDLFHGLNQRLPAGPRRGRAVSTFHDLFVMTGDYSSAEFRERFARLAHEAAARSDSVIAVSEFTAGQVEQLLGVERARIRVVRHGVRLPAADSPRPARENMILHVGAVQKRKNLVRLVDAFEHTPPDWRLVFAGSAGYGAAEVFARIERSPRRAGIDLVGYLSDAQRDELYARASLFAFPSLDEGFGMPVLEAMAWGVPVLASNRAALPEVCGDAAVLVDPEDGDAITATMTALIEDQARRVDLARKGLARARNFPWQNAVDQTWNVYGELTAR